MEDNPNDTYIGTGVQPTAASLKASIKKMHASHRNIFFLVVFIIALCAVSASFFIFKEVEERITESSQESEVVTEVQNKEELKVQIPTTPDYSRGRLPHTEITTRLERLHKSFKETNTTIPSIAVAHSVESLAITHWNTPLETVSYKDGDIMTADGTYIVPEDSIALISVFENNIVKGTHLINNVSKPPETTMYSISLGTYVKGKKDYRIEIDGVASCRLQCAPSDTACQTTNTAYCGTDFTNQRMVAYTPRTVGIADLYTDKTCLMKEFQSGPANIEDKDSCMTTGFVERFYLEAQKYVMKQKLDASTKQSFTQDLGTYYSALTGGTGNNAISRNLGEASWTFGYKKSTENDTGMCEGKVVVKVNCPL